MDYDAPHAIDIELLERHIRDYATCHAIDAPIYDFAQHLRVRDRHEHIAAKSLLIVEGILALHFARLRPQQTQRIGFCVNCCGIATAWCRCAELSCRLGLRSSAAR
jgi:uridine kinase